MFLWGDRLIIYDIVWLILFFLFLFNKLVVRREDT